MKDLSKESTETLFGLLEAFNTVHVYLSIRGECDDNHGVCRKVRAALEPKYEDYIVFKLISAWWPLYSGDPEYPIPNTDQNCPYTEYHYGDMYIGKQLELRLNLLEHCIQVVQQELRSRDGVMQ